MYYRRINPATVLKLIRDNDSSKGTILQQVSSLYPRGSKSHLLQLMRRICRELEHAGLVDQAEGGQYKITELADRVINALDLSLTELSEWSSGSLLVKPTFGAPQPQRPLEHDVFVLMPFSNDLLPVYEDHIASVCSKLGLAVARADDFFAAESIVKDIWNAINSSRLVIADCTSRNPNVFYEIGISHTVGRPTILISQDINDVPFDLRHIRCIVYDYTPRGMIRFQDALTKTLEAELEKL